MTHNTNQPGGGECGPRAWMGRFICKAFGIPTWGVREPGHAAMARWTADEGWVVCLGADMRFAWWEDMSGLYFQLETVARKVCSTDPFKPNVVYGDKVMTLEWIADMLGEPRNDVVRNNMADPKALWRSLSLMQRRRLAQKTTATQEPAKQTSLDTNGLSCVCPQLERLKLRNESANVETTATLENGTIIIPAAKCSNPTKPTGTVMFMNSFLGGKQLFLDKDGHVEYTLTSAMGGKYEMTCRFVTVHDDKVKPPLLVTVDSDDDDVEKSGENLCSVYSIPLPYTKGMWQETDPVVVELPTNTTTCKIALTRESSDQVPARGMAMKDIKLVPIKS